MKPTPDRRGILQAMLTFSHQAFAPAMDEITGDLPDAVGNALIIGEGTLPGYVTRTIEGPRDEPDRTSLIDGLRAESLFDDALIAEWFIENAERYPAFANYIIHHECMRQFALETLGVGGSANAASTIFADRADGSG